jgi:hypothetical protein
MTAVGKILVFLNLVFSLVVGAFVIMVYVARTHWVEDFNKLKGQYDIMRSSTQAYQSEVDKAKADANTEIQKIQAELKSAQRDLVTERTANAQLNDELVKERKKNEQQVALASQAVKDVEKRQEDVGKLRDTLRAEREANNALSKKNAELVTEATVAKIERGSFQDMNNRLEAQLQEMAKENARLQRGGGARTMARAGAKNPPPDNVEGLVKDLDASGLMTITIGSDAGLAKNQTLELFRLNPAKYLGTVRILEADAHQAVVQPVGRLSAPPQKGDRVASRILGG